jgi:hypothetical protein
MDLTEGSETSAQLILTPGKYPKESTKYKILAFNFRLQGFSISDEILDVTYFWHEKGPSCMKMGLHAAYSVTVKVKVKFILE